MIGWVMRMLDEHKAKKIARHMMLDRVEQEAQVIEQRIRLVERLVKARTQLEQQ